ncbi:MAG: hypothetical protein MZW92_77415 [Comamonadaceae bacterium]|nr:hypothetical protein [Comamonadaceae bacterium]
MKHDRGRRAPASSALIEPPSRCATSRCKPEHVDVIKTRHGRRQHRAAPARAPSQGAPYTCRRQDRHRAGVRHEAGREVRRGARRRSACATTPCSSPSRRPSEPKIALAVLVENGGFGAQRRGADRAPGARLLPARQGARRAGSGPAKTTEATARRRAMSAARLGCGVLRRRPIDPPLLAIIGAAAIGLGAAGAGSARAATTPGALHRPGACNLGDRAGGDVGRWRQDPAADADAPRACRSMSSGVRAAGRRGAVRRRRQGRARAGSTSASRASSPRRS